MRLPMTTVADGQVTFTIRDVALTMPLQTWAETGNAMALDVSWAPHVDQDVVPPRELGPGEMELVQTENTELPPSNGDQRIQVIVAEPLDDQARRHLLLVLDHQLQAGGDLVCHVDTEGVWAVGYHFGREADDSPMAGGAAYGLGPTLTTALLGLHADLGLTPTED